MTTPSADFPLGTSPRVTRTVREALLPPGSVVAIGSFDGVHLGHQAVLDHAIELRHTLGQKGEVAALTFDPHPAKVLAPELAPALICTTEQRVQWLGEAGADRVILQPFDRTLAGISAADFVGDILVGQLRAAGIVVGFDFTFGKGGEGNVALLREEGARRDVRVVVVEPYHKDGMLVSSTKIREFVLSGRVYGALTLLGRPFQLSGPVVRGAGRGRSLGFPTANVAWVQELVPAHGVYAARARVDGELVDAAVSIGIVPTFGHDNAVTVEAYLLDFSGDLYGKTICLELVRRLRPEKRFHGPEELVTQITEDVKQVRDILLTL
ncbi:MAG: bifunctional riboflavin kinase/FAD synthetase [bacterium]